MTRRVEGLLWARVLAQRPACIPVGRPRGIKREGVRYEETLASGTFGSAKRGVWLEFADANGHGYAQCDFLVAEGVCGALVPVVAEAKLTWRREAYGQLRGLYLPLLRAALGRDVGALVVCANLTPETPRAAIAGSLSEALARCARGEVPVLRVAAGASGRSPSKPGLRLAVARPKVPKWWGSKVPVLGV